MVCGNANVRNHTPSPVVVYEIGYASRNGMIYHCPQMPWLIGLFIVGFAILFREREREIQLLSSPLSIYIYIIYIDIYIYTHALSSSNLGVSKHWVSWTHPNFCWPWYTIGGIWKHPWILQWEHDQPLPMELHPRESQDHVTLFEEDKAAVLKVPSSMRA